MLATQVLGGGGCNDENPTAGDVVLFFSHRHCIFTGREPEVALQSFSFNIIRGISSVVRLHETMLSKYEPYGTVLFLFFARTATAALEL